MILRGKLRHHCVSLTVSILDSLCFLLIPKDPGHLPAVSGPSGIPVPSSPAMYIYQVLSIFVGFPGGSAVEESSCQCRRRRRCKFDSWFWKIPWRRKWQPTPVFLTGESHRHRGLVGYSPWGCKESDMTDHALSSTFIETCWAQEWYSACLLVLRILEKSPQPTW